MATTGRGKATEGVSMAGAESVESEERSLYQDLVDALPGGVYRLRVRSAEIPTAKVWRDAVDTTYSVDYVSERFAEILGITRAEFLRNAGIVPDLVVEEDRPGFFERNVEAVATLTPFHWEGRAKVRGETRWVRLESLPRRLASGDVVWTGVIEDITDRKRAEVVRAATYSISEVAESSGSLNEFFGRVHEIVGTVIPASNFYVALLDEAAGTLCFPYFVDEVDPPPAPKPLGRGLTEYVIRTGEPLLATPEFFDDLAARGDVVLHGAPSVDWLGAPLKTSDKTIGAVVVQTYAAAVRFGAPDKDFLSFVSGQLATAIERKRTEESLRESATRFQRFFELPLIGACISSPTKEWLEINDRLCQILGYSREELWLLTWADLTHPDDLESDVAQFERMLRGQSGGYTIEKRFIRKDGSSVPIELSAACVRKPDGSVDYCVALFQDLTDRKRAEVEAGRISRLYLALIGVNEAIVRVRTAGELFCDVCRVLVESGGFKMAWLGWRDEASPQVLVVGSHGDDSGYLSGVRIFADHRPEGLGPTGTAIREGRAYVCNDFMGDPRTLPWREAATRALFQASAAFPVRVAGETLGVLSVYSAEVDFFGDREVALLEEAATDISFALDNLERGENLREREREMREAQAIAGFGSYVLDFGTGRWKSSEALDAIFGIGPEWDRSVSGWGKLIHPEDREATTHYLAEEVFGKGSCFDRHYRIVRPADGEVRWVYGKGEVSLAPDRTVTRLRGTIADVTNQRIASERVTQLNAELELRVKERTAELEAFSYSVSHDLRAPLRAIEGFSSMVVRDHSEHLDVEGQRLLGVVRKNALRMSALIDDLLLFARAGRSEVRRGRCDMNAIAQSAFEEVVADPEARARIDFRLGELPEVEGDVSLLRQVWINLLSNAVKFSALVLEPMIKIEGAVEGDFAVYRVSENGVGFDMAHADKLFGVFQRLHGMTEFEGTGIGLALVRRIVIRHGGRVWAKGAIGQGATFSFTLPVKAPSDISTSFKKVVLP
jgi:PAS domain S-box-containing protein